MSTSRGKLNIITAQRGDTVNIQCLDSVFSVLNGTDRISVSFKKTTQSGNICIQTYNNNHWMGKQCPPRITILWNNEPKTIYVRMQALQINDSDNYICEVKILGTAKIQSNTSLSVTGKQKIMFVVTTCNHLP